LFLLVYYSEFRDFTGTKPFLWRFCIISVWPWRAAAVATAAAADVAAAAARSYPTPPPFVDEYTFCFICLNSDEQPSL
jgi:hypothetical protein